MLYFNLETFIGRKTLYILKSCRINSASKAMSLLSYRKMSFVYIMSIPRDIIFNRISLAIAVKTRLKHAGFSHDVSFKQILIQRPVCCFPI